MTRVFADTFYFLALLNPRDPAHEDALVFYGDTSLHFTTTEWVLTEVGDATAIPDARPGFRKLIELLENDNHVKIIQASHELFHRGLSLYFQRPDKEWTLTDCISFTVMREEGLADALTGDHHFEQAGFSVLIRDGNG
jgi:predicted nucleic acid-binding protein